jgi:hypothetical protein
MPGDERLVIKTRAWAKRLAGSAKFKSRKIFEGRHLLFRTESLEENSSRSKKVLANLV